MALIDPAMKHVSPFNQLFLHLKRGASGVWHSAVPGRPSGQAVKPIATQRFHRQTGLTRIGTGASHYACFGR